MGRRSTGAICHYAAKRIQINFLKKNGYLNSGQITQGTLSWNRNGDPCGSITLIVDTSTSVTTMRLIYSNTDYDGNKENLDYTVNLVKVQSNLGKGYRYYFICPKSKERCTILYKAYGSLYFKHRNAYLSRLYYDSQIESKRVRDFRYFKYECDVDRIYENGFKKTYKGKPTKKALKVEKLILKERNTYQRLTWFTS